MVADTGPDMLFPTLTWAYAAAAQTDPGSYGSPRATWVPVDAGRRRLPAARCAAAMPLRTARLPLGALSLPKPTAH
jgi:hypothetical protein